MMAKAETQEKSEYMAPKEVFRRAKGGTALNYALVVSKKRGEDPAFIVHKKKGTKQLLKAAKEKSGNKIGIIGTLTCTTKTFDLVCEEGKPTVMMAKQLRLFLKKNQLKQKVSIKTLDGQMIGDGEETDDEAETAATGAAAQPEPQEDTEATPAAPKEQAEEKAAPKEDKAAGPRDELDAAQAKVSALTKKAQELEDLRQKMEGQSNPEAQTAAMNTKPLCREARETAGEAETYLKNGAALLAQAEKAGGGAPDLVQDALDQVHAALNKLEEGEYSADKAEKMMEEARKASDSAPAPDAAPEQEQAAKQEQQEVAQAQPEASPASNEDAAPTKTRKDDGPVRALLEKIKAAQKETKKAVAQGEALTKIREKVASQGDPQSEVAAMNSKGTVRDAVEVAQEADQFIRQATEQAKKAAQASEEDEPKFIREAESYLGGIAQKLEEAEFSAQRAQTVLSEVTEVSLEPEEAPKEEKQEAKKEEPQTAPSQAADVPEELAKAVDNRKAFKKARTLWVKARDEAVVSLEQVKQGARDAYMDDLEQFPVVQRKLGDLDEILDNLNDDLRKTLDAYVSTPLRKQQRMEELADEAKELLSDYMAYVRKSELLDGIDQKEFANVTMKAPLLKALQNLERAIV